ncbi:MAG: ATP-dependent protease [Alphaproteobacteria bacterium]|nr:ATP-dependent protease [Alphaproteobacteria bacterium]
MAEPARLPSPLPAEALYRTCDAAGLGFVTTDELVPLDEALGQDRAVEAVGFGLGIRRPGYNIVAIGPPGIGKRSLIDRHVRTHAASEPTPADWVYVNNFAEPHKPRALSLPPGRGSALKRDIQALIEELRTALPAAFESDDYRARRQTIDGSFKQRHDQIFRQIEHEAKERGIGIIRTPVGLALAPMRNDEVLAPEAFHKLPEEERNRLTLEMGQVQEKLQAALEQAAKLEGERRERVRELHREVTRNAIGYRLDALARGYADLPAVVAHLEVVERDLVDNAETLLAQSAPPSDAPGEALARRALGEARPFDRYQVNLLVDRSAGGGAPVVSEDHPMVQNLIGRIEYRPMFGNLVTDFSLIKPGALHQANGGYLVLDARRVLMQPFAWEELKRALRARQVQIRSLADSLGLVSTVTLQPEPIPLDLKVVLTGDRLLHYLLAELDPDYGELFKVAADFEDDLPRGAGSEAGYARLIASIARREGLLALDAPAVARAIEHGARLAGDHAKITAHLEPMADLLREADHLARGDASTRIGAADVQRAIDRQQRRAGRLRERALERIANGTVLIDTAGERVGQVNGLSVIPLGGFAFGHPSRITARVRLGRGQVIDIEREVKLGGPLHSKGVLILAGFLGGRFGRERPLALSASLVFEQSYGGVEGDSASMAELCAILSALAEVPIRQGIAITGSVNQHGAAQPIGGVNEKIEGFFDVCRQAGLDGRQGVAIPEANRRHLMLRRDVVEAVAAGKFFIHAVSDVDQALAVLTGRDPGTRDSEGRYGAGTLYRRVEEALVKLAATVREFGASPETKERAS